jgi:hypothetical protein
MVKAITAEDIKNQRDWSIDTFGPGPRTHGVLNHIRKEIVEIEDSPYDLSEWVDVIILAIDGAWRSGWTAEEIIEEYFDKMTTNYGRDWPDWRTMSEHEAIEHVR